LPIASSRINFVAEIRLVALDIVLLLV